MLDLAVIALPITYTASTENQAIGLMPISKSSRAPVLHQVVELFSKKTWLLQSSLECKSDPSPFVPNSNNETSSYFSRYALEEVYLKSPKYAKYINKELLEKYYPVGGVRIEDDLLITDDGYENLTTVPKGEEALKVINEGKEQEEGREANKKAAESKNKQKKSWFW